MIDKAVYKDNGDIEIDNTELLENRADIEGTNDHNIWKGGEEWEDKYNTFKGHRGGLGGLKGGDEENKLKTDKKRTGWNEPSHKTGDVLHICPVCNTRYYGRSNKNYCTTKCKEIAKKRRQRKRKRDIRDFKPYRGKAGEVYFMSEAKGKEVITFVPAFNADSRTHAKKYLEDTYSEPNDYYEQVKGVIRK